MDNTTNNAVPTNQYRPMGAWGYFGYEILFSIPLVGFILLLVFAFDSSYIARRNFARSFFCVYVLVIIAVIVIISLSGVLATLIPGLTELFNRLSSLN